MSCILKQYIFNKQKYREIIMRLKESKNIHFLFNAIRNHSAHNTSFGMMGSQAIHWGNADECQTAENCQHSRNVLLIWNLLGMSHYFKDMGKIYWNWLLCTAAPYSVFTSFSKFPHRVLHFDKGSCVSSKCWWLMPPKKHSTFTGISWNTCNFSQFNSWLNVQVTTL